MPSKNLENKARDGYQLFPGTPRTLERYPVPVDTRCNLVFVFVQEAQQKDDAESSRRNSLPAALPQLTTSPQISILNYPILVIVNQYIYGYSFPQLSISVLRCDR